MHAHPLFRGLLTALFLLFWLLLTSAAHAARLALVVGNDQYQNISKLRNAVADAQTMGEAFRKAGYQVMVVTNVDLRVLKDELRAFRRRVRGGDEVVLYFSGHGVQLGAENFLLPVDVRSDTEEQVRDDGLALSAVLADLRTAKPGFTLAIIDACRDNPFKKAGKSIGGRGLASPPSATGEMVLFAAGEGQQALDRLSATDPVRNGVFTRVFVNEMQRPGLSIDQTLRNVRVEVNRLAQSVNHEQVPALYDQVLGTYYFYPPRAQVAGVVAEPVRTAPVAQPSPQPAQPSPPVQAPAPQPAPSTAQALRPGSVIKDCSDCPELVVIPAGRFMMGSNDGNSRESSEKPIHPVNIKQFAIGKTEVTQAQWQAVMGSNPSKFTNCGSNCPVEQVSWNDVQQFIQKLNAKTGQSYRLPSEAEWEYAARAGSQSKYSFGDSDSDSQLGQHAWYKENSGNSTKPVAGKQANAFGLHDIHGNVLEWVKDCWHDNYNGAPTDGSAWTTSCTGNGRVLRGGSWLYGPASLRSADRMWDSPDRRGSGTGFRLARTLVTP